MATGTGWQDHPRADTDGEQATVPTGDPDPTAPAGLLPAVAAGTVFIASGAVLMLEILAVRLLAPYVGLTLETTTSIIGAVLAGIALGAAIGGWFADRVDPRRLLVGLLIGGGLLALLTVPIVRWLGPGARGHGGDLSALGITAASLVPSAAVLSAVSPTVARLQLNDLRASGTIVGRLSAFATAGALVGTFGTGFVIVPRMSVSSAVLAIGLALVVVGLVLGVALRALARAAVAGALAATIALAVLTASRDSPCDVETRYHCAVIVASSATGRDLFLDTEANSHVDLADPTYLEHYYARWVAKVINTTTPAGRPRRMVVVGGGGGTLANWLLATRPGSHVEMLEVDQELVELDQKRLGLKLSPSLQSKVGDARTTLHDLPSGSADVVVGDAFSGLTVPWHLLTREWIEDVRRVLKPGGLYLLNVIDFQPNNLLKAELATLLPLFKDVQFVVPPDQDGLPLGGNTVIVASDTTRSYGFDPSADGAAIYLRWQAEVYAEGAPRLRDDFAPVDQLLSRVVKKG